MAAIISAIILAIKYSGEKENKEVEEVELTSSLFTIDEEVSRQTYEQLLDHMIDQINEHAHLIDDEGYIDYFIGKALVSISSTNKDNTLSIRNHKNTKENIEDHYKNIEAHTLKNGLNGVIAKHKSYDEIDFFQLESEDDKALIHLSTASLETDMDKAKKYLTNMIQKIKHIQSKT